MNKSARATTVAPSQEKEELIEDLQNQLTFKTVEIETLKTELSRYQSALDKKSAIRAGTWHELDCREQDGFPRKRAMGVSAEPVALKTATEEKLKKYSKSARIREILHRAIAENDLLQNLEDSQAYEIVDCMYPVTFASGSLIIREGEYGSVVYVMEDGVVEVSKDGHPLRQIMYPSVFGELAILYNCLRTATADPVQIPMAGN
nr:unnamed protein product [Spirometra erinaceieuropaei]